MARRAALLSGAIGLLVLMATIAPASARVGPDGGSRHGDEIVAVARTADRAVVRSMNLKPLSVLFLVVVLCLASLAVLQALHTRATRHVRVAGPTWRSPIVGRAPPRTA